MDAFEWSAGIYASALAMAKCMTPTELTRTALVFTQLGTTLATLAALQNLEAGDTAEAEDLADLG